MLYIFTILENFDIWKLDNFWHFREFWRENFVLDIAWRIRSFNYPNEITKVFQIKFHITHVVIWIFNQIFISYSKMTFFYY